MKIATCAFALLAVALAPTTGYAADDQWQVGTTPSFSSGKYGTESRTEVFHTPITARRLFTDGDLTLAFPFLCIKGEGGVTIVNGSPIRTDPTNSTRTSGVTTTTRSGTSTSTRGTGTTTQNTGAVTEPPPATTSRTTSCGMGDIVVRGRYYIVDERNWWPTVALRAHFKAPTAPANAGMGTGRPDEGVGLEVSRTVADTTFMVDGGYTLIGKPVDVEFRNHWWYDVGIGQDLARGVINVSVFFEEYSAIVPGYINARDVLAALTVKSTSGWRLHISGEVGLSDGAPDHGITFGASRRF